MDEHQKIFDDWKKSLPENKQRAYDFISNAVKQFQSFDLLANVSFYNHLHNADKYTDDRGDKHFFISEVLALLCLKNPFVETSSISENDFFKSLKDIQENALKYCMLKDALDFKGKMRGEDTIADLANILQREAKTIRNPGLPDHHLIFVAKLYKPLSKEFQSLFGFSIEESIIIRNSISELLNQKYFTARNFANEKASSYLREIKQFRKNNTLTENSVFSIENLQEYSGWDERKLRQNLNIHVLGELHYNFGQVFSITDVELSEFTEVDLVSIQNFLTRFSCGFPSLNDNDEIHDTTSILRTKPILHHGGKYLIASIPLLFWAIEEQFEMEIKNIPKLSGRYSKIKHDFVLNQGLEYFKQILPTAIFYEPNLYYTIEDNRYETDTLFVYDRILFIVEAKGHKISGKAKKGDEQRTETHLKDILKSSYEQGIRTFEYIDKMKIAEFKTENGQKIYIDRSQIEDVIIISLTHEAIGNLAMSIKVTNELGYFQEKYFPFILSIYDLITFADLFENPILFVHYLKRRKKFLTIKTISTYEELDLLAYYMQNGLHVEHLLKGAEGDKAHWVELLPNTDEINDYYMYKFGNKTKFTPKPKIKISNEFNDFLLQLDNSKLNNRIIMALQLLEFNDKAIKDFMARVKKVKKEFAKDKKLHDGSIYSESKDGLGITFMTCQNKHELNFKLYSYCSYKMDQLNSNTWVGFGDTSPNTKIYNFQSMFIAIRNGESVTDYNAIRPNS
jgi:hypothetical protein